MISLDPPEHNQYRRMVSPWFASRRVRQLEDRIRERVVAILDHLKGADTCDFVTDIAAELPIQMLAELLEVPQDDRNRLFQWSNALIAEDDTEYRPSPEALANTIAAMSEYALGLRRERLECPGDEIHRVSYKHHCDRFREMGPASTT
jgi:cytochrome P450